MDGQTVVHQTDAMESPKSPASMASALLAEASYALNMETEEGFWYEDGE